MSRLLDEFPHTVTPTPADAELARESSRQLVRFVSATKRAPLRLRIQSDGVEEETISIPAPAFRLLSDILTQMAQGNAITIIPIHAELTTQQAADILHVSRPFLIGLLENKTIPHHKVGSHRRVRFQDLMNYKRSIDQKRLESLEELAKQAQELDMGY